MNYFQQQKQDQKDIVNVFILAHDRGLALIIPGVYMKIPNGLNYKSTEAWIKMKRNELNG